MIEEVLTGEGSGGLVPVLGTARTLHDARRAVEESRARIAATLDELEDRIVEKKEAIQRKADVVRPVREAIRKTPLIALGVAIAVGLLLGVRGGSDDDEEENEYGFEKSERKALDEWKRRRRKLLMAEAEEADEELFEEDNAPGPFGRFMRSIGHEVGGIAVGIIAAEVAERLYKPMHARSARPADDVRDEHDTSLDDEYDPEYPDQDVAYDNVGEYAEDAGDDMEYGDDVEYRG